MTLESLLSSMHDLALDEKLYPRRNDLLTKLDNLLVKTFYRIGNRGRTFLHAVNPSHTATYAYELSATAYVVGFGFCNAASTHHDGNTMQSLFSIYFSIMSATCFLSSRIIKSNPDLRSLIEEELHQYHQQQSLRGPKIDRFLYLATSIFMTFLPFALQDSSQGKNGELLLYGISAVGVGAFSCAVGRYLSRAYYRPSVEEKIKEYHSLNLVDKK